MKVSNLVEARRRRIPGARVAEPADARPTRPSTPAAERAVEEEHHPGAQPGGLDLEDAFFEYAGRIRAFLLRMGINAHDVDDLVSETFLIAHQRRATFDAGRAPLPWLFGIAFNRARLHRRRRWVVQLLGRALAREPGHQEASDTERSLLRAEDVQRVRRTLAAMPDKKRALLVLRDLEELSTQEIAIAVGIPVGSVYSGLYQARKAFLRTYRRFLAREASDD